MESKHSEIFVAVIVCTTMVMFLILVTFSVILYKRKKRYGKFYILTNPPLIDYIEKIDGNKLLVEQTNKLPYLSEWEFPRKRVFIGKSTLLISTLSFS